MTATMLGGTATARDLLFGDARQGPDKALRESLGRSGTVRAHIPGPVGLSTVVDREVATKTDGLLSLNLADVVVAGWSRFDALMESARRTRAAGPTTEEIVALVTHRIESSYRPTVEVFLDGRTLATINIQLLLAFTISGVHAVIQQGRLTAVRTGSCTVTGSLAAQGTVLAKREHRFDLAGAVRLRHGIPLLSDDANPPLAMPSR